MSVSRILCFLSVAFTTYSCTSETPDPCERICSPGFQCERVPSSSVEGTFREICVSTVPCSPTCGEGETCVDGACASACDPECPTYKVCSDGECAFPSYGLGCSQVLACRADCSDDDAACLTGCEEAANAIGGNLYGVYKRCSDDNNCSDAGCVDTYCINEARACQGLPPLCDPACPSGFRCSANAECIPVGSGGCDPPCLQGQSCIDGVCRLGNDCSAGDSTTCIGNILQRCQNGGSVSIDCAEVGPQCACASIPDEGRSDCICNGQRQPCNPPCPSPTMCINGSCE